MPKNWEEKFLSRVPVDDVWIRNFFPKPTFPFSEVIEMHRELAQPAMTDNMEGMLHMEVHLDFRTKKKVYIHIFRWPFQYLSWDLFVKSNHLILT